LLIACQLIIQQLVDRRIMQHLFNLLDVARVVHLIRQHLLVLIPSNQKLLHLVLIGLIQMQAEFLLYVQVA